MNLTFQPTGHDFDHGLTTRGRRAGDRYIFWVGAMLLGYALFSRTFAYIGVPPLFIGEIMILIGLTALVRAGRLGPILSQPPAWLMVALVALAAYRTVPFLGQYGVDAVRDFMMIGYAVYAVIVGGLVVAWPARLLVLVEKYSIFAVVMVSLVWATYLVSRIAPYSVPPLPWAGDVRLVEAKGGDIMVHLCAITAFAVLGLMERKPWFMLALAANTAIVVTSNRGGMLAYAIGFALAYAMRPPEARVGRLVYAFVLFAALGILAGPLARIEGTARTISVDQIALNVKSIFGQGDEGLDGTKKWRLQWWTKIWDGTFHGPYFWTGRGFGVNLAVADGFDVIKELRSPHNGHMTVLARMGVPGFVMWIAMLGLWTASLFVAWLRARRAGRHRWMALFAFLIAYMVAIHVNASFDVYLEGPMGGIWFWTVFGLGLACIHLQRTHPNLLDHTGLSEVVLRPTSPTFAWHIEPDDTDSSPPVPTFTWNDDPRPQSSAEPARPDAAWYW